MVLEIPFLISHANQPRDPEKPSEDDVLLRSCLLGVFDSVGGRDNGRLVSHLARRIIAAYWEALSETERQESPEQLERVLQSATQQADRAIAALSIPAEQRRPATTLALCALSFQRSRAYASVAHIGDSRVYLARLGQPLRRLTIDHGYFGFAVRRKLLTEANARRIEQAEHGEDLSPEDYAHFERRHQITCAVGWSDFPTIPVSSHPLLPGDQLILCTDGLHDNLADREIEALVRTPGKAAALQLVNAASQRSQQTHIRAKRDDISAIVAWYPSALLC
ncbi:MAG TPA: PP2C family serine/threonine-protein phosphatase [Ktedonobacteraceae bacterium]|nr:PP2C family serine/threonine-protein phosphatase [Ktedonobacteraceae bacterium]